MDKKKTKKREYFFREVRSANKVAEFSRPTRFKINKSPSGLYAETPGPLKGAHPAGLQAPGPRTLLRCDSYPTAGPPTDSARCGAASPALKCLRSTCFALPACLTAIFGNLTEGAYFYVAVYLVCPPMK